jgi:hypothetical protein
MVGHTWEKGPHLILEATESFEEGAGFVWAQEKDRLFISVSEEKAVDSYNSSFECTLTATREQAVQLRNWLVSLNL